MTTPETVDPPTDQRRAFCDQLIEISLSAGSVAQSPCTRFRLERVVLALANHHGLDLDVRPWNVRTRAGIGA